jgi:hypothetical protein
VQATTIASGRVQTVLYRLRGRTAVVAAATQRLDEARARLAETQAARRSAVLQIQQAEESQKSLPDPDLRKRMEDIYTPLKPSLETLGAEEQQRQARVVEPKGSSAPSRLIKLGEL